MRLNRLVAVAAVISGLVVLNAHAQVSRGSRHSGPPARHQAQPDSAPTEVAEDSSTDSAAPRGRGGRNREDLNRMGIPQLQRSWFCRQVADLCTPGGHEFTAHRARCNSRVVQDLTSGMAGGSERQRQARTQIVSAFDRLQERTETNARHFRSARRQFVETCRRQDPLVFAGGYQFRAPGVAEDRTQVTDMPGDADELRTAIRSMDRSSQEHMANLLRQRAAQARVEAASQRAVQRADRSRRARRDSGESSDARCVAQADSASQVPSGVDVWTDGGDSAREWRRAYIDCTSAAATAAASAGTAGTNSELRAPAQQYINEASGAGAGAAAAH